MPRIEIGEHIVSDPRVCGGRLTSKGTRVLVHFHLVVPVDASDHTPSWGPGQAER